MNFFHNFFYSFEMKLYFIIKNWNISEIRPSTNNLMYIWTTFHNFISISINQSQTKSAISSLLSHFYFWIFNSDEKFGIEKSFERATASKSIVQRYWNQWFQHVCKTFHNQLYQKYTSFLRNINGAKHFFLNHQIKSWGCSLLSIMAKQFRKELFLSFISL